MEALGILNSKCRVFIFPIIKITPNGTDTAFMALTLTIKLPILIIHSLKNVKIFDLTLCMKNRQF